MYLIKDSGPGGECIVFDCEGKCVSFDSQLVHAFIIDGINIFGRDVLEKIDGVDLDNFETEVFPDYFLVRGEIIRDIVSGASEQYVRKLRSLPDKEIVVFSDDGDAAGYCRHAPRVWVKMDEPTLADLMAKGISTVCRDIYAEHNENVHGLEEGFSSENSPLVREVVAEVLKMHEQTWRDMEDFWGES